MPFSASVPAHFNPCLYDAGDIYRAKVVNPKLIRLWNVIGPKHLSLCRSGFTWANNIQIQMWGYWHKCDQVFFSNCILIQKLPAYPHILLQYRCTAVTNLEKQFWGCKKVCSLWIQIFELGKGTISSSTGLTQAWSREWSLVVVHGNVAQHCN